jgi:hypothetical protein
MKRSLNVCLYSLCICLLLVSGYLLANPVSVLASDCSATCNNGSVSVSGTFCTCTDYMGCAYTTQQGGSYMYRKACQ